VVGRLLIGLIVDKCDRRAVACGNFLVQSAGTAVLAASPSAPMLYLGCILFGLGLGNLISLPGLIVQQEFAAQHFSRIVGLILAVNQFAFAFGPGLLGFLREASGDYTDALAACFIGEVAAAVIVISPRIGRLVSRALARKEL
jgi:MFS family permease